MSEKKILEERSLILNRRSFLGKTALGVGGVALASLIGANYLKRARTESSQKLMTHKAFKAY